jgi:hypothetical protein
MNFEKPKNDKKENEDVGIGLIDPDNVIPNPDKLSFEKDPDYWKKGLGTKKESQTDKDSDKSSKPENQDDESSIWDKPLDRK